MRARSGAALVFALLILVILDCVLVGTLQLAAQQRRVSAFRAEHLRVQLAAESAITRALAHWPAALAADAPPGTHVAASMTERDTRGVVRYEMLRGGLALVRATASDPAGIRHDAAVLAHPPVLPDSADFARAAVSAAISVTVHDAGRVTAGSSADCSGQTPVAVVSPAVIELAGALMDGVIERADPDPPLRFFPAAPSDTVLAENGAGFISSAARLRIGAGVRFEGLILAAGDVTIEPGAEVTGAILTRGSVHVLGAVTADPCAVRSVIRSQGLRAGRPAEPRTWVPAF